MSKVLITELGGTVQFRPAPEHLGPGQLLVFGVNQPGHAREAEIYLSPQNLVELKELITEEIYG